MRIDVHAHYFPAAYTEKLADLGLEHARRGGQSDDLSGRLKTLDDNHCDCQILSAVGLDTQVPSLAGAVEGARLANDLYAETVTKTGGRFRAFGWVPLPYVDEAIAEAVRCLDELNFAGICFACFYQGPPLDDKAFEPFWAELNKRKAKAYIHPVGAHSTCHPGMGDFNLSMSAGSMAQLARTLTQAARVTHLTQPAMNVSLKKLRAYFKDELVVYDSQETRYTELAQALRPRIRQILQASREAMALSPAFDPTLDEGRLTIAMPGILELLLLPRLAAIVNREAPRTQIASVPFRHESADRLFRTEMDIAVMAESFVAPGFVSAPLISDTMCCLVWDESRHGKTITEAEFFAAAHVGVPQPDGGPTHPNAIALRRLSERQNVMVRASSYAALPHVIVGTDLIATTLSSYARLCETMLPVRIVPSPIELPRMQFIAVWQSYRVTESILEWLVEKLREASIGLGTEPLAADRAA